MSTDKYINISAITLPHHYPLVALKLQCITFYQQHKFIWLGFVEQCWRKAMQTFTTAPTTKGTVTINLITWTCLKVHVGFKSKRK